MQGPGTMARWVQTFLQAQAAELDAATNTHLAYARDLQGFAEWLAGGGLQAVLHESFDVHRCHLWQRLMHPLK